MASSTTGTISVFGSINMDFVVRADHLPVPGESVIGDEFFQAFGGKGANQAVGIARLSTNKVNFVGSVGNDDIGTQGIESLRTSGVNTDYMRVVDGVSSGVALIMLDAKGENCISGATGANAYVDSKYVSSLPDELFDTSTMIVVCQEIPLEAIEIVVARAAAYNKRVLFNPAPPNPRLNQSSVLKNVTYLTPNETEVEAITGIQIHSAEDLEGKRRAIQKMMDLGASSIAITMGAAGCFAYDSGSMTCAEEAQQIAAPPTDAIDTTAAGDSFNAALAVALTEGKTFNEACEWANKVAAISVTRKGAQPSLPHRRDLR